MDLERALKQVRGVVKRKAKKLPSPRLRLLGRRGRTRIYEVDATAVRKLTHLNPNAPDFTMGTGDQVWPEVTGPNEVWVSNEIKGLERRLTILHECHEHRRMLRDGLSYETAHGEALALEDKYRQAKGRGLTAALKRERIKLR